MIDGQSLCIGLDVVEKTFGSIFADGNIVERLMPTIDLNSDLAEGYGTYRCGDDDAMLSLVTSANVACGFHAGDPEIMAQAFKLAKERGVAVGAHPGFPDLWGFGRRRIPLTAGEIERVVAYQIGAAQALASYAGHRITYVKAHGALGNMMEADQSMAGLRVGMRRWRNGLASAFVIRWPIWPSGPRRE